MIIHYSLPSNNHFIEPVAVIFYTSCVPGMLNKMIPTWKLSYITLAYISKLIKLATAQNTSFKISLKSNINNIYSNEASTPISWYIVFKILSKVWKYFSKFQNFNKFQNTSLTLGSAPQLYLLFLKWGFLWRLEWPNKGTIEP